MILESNHPVIYHPDRDCAVRHYSLAVGEVLRAVRINLIGDGKHTHPKQKTEIKSAEVAEIVNVWDETDAQIYNRENE